MDSHQNYKVPLAEPVNLTQPTFEPSSMAAMESSALPSSRFVHVDERLPFPVSPNAFLHQRSARSAGFRAGSG